MREPVFDPYDKVHQWRRDELLRMWPELKIRDVERVAANGRRELLHEAARLHAGDCPAELALEILR